MDKPRELTASEWECAVMGAWVEIRRLTAVHDQTANEANARGDRYATATNDGIALGHARSLRILEQALASVRLQDSV